MQSGRPTALTQTVTNSCVNWIKAPPPASAGLLLSYIILYPCTGLVPGRIDGLFYMNSLCMCVTDFLKKKLSCTIHSVCASVDENVWHGSKTPARSTVHKTSNTTRQHITKLVFLPEAQQACHTDAPTKLSVTDTGSTWTVSGSGTVMEDAGTSGRRPFLN